MQLIKITQKADQAAAVLGACAALGGFVTGRYTFGMLCAGAALFSALSARYKPLQWAARKILLYQLQH